MERPNGMHMPPAMRRTAAAAVLVLAIAAGTAILYGHGAPTASAQGEGSPAPAEIVRVIGVGIVLTADGALWVYRPDREAWLTIDESFRAEGRRSKVLPLPVAPADIREMETWGFILTREGKLWLYDVEDDRWKELPAPGAR